MKKIFTYLVLSIFFFSCKKNSVDNKAINQSPSVSVAEAKAFLSNQSLVQTNSADGHSFNPATLLSEIDWRKAATINNGKTLIGVAKGQPTVNGTKIGFRKAVFFKDSLGKTEMLILEFIPDVYHLWKYGGVKRNSYDGKVFIYDKGYNLKRGYLYKSGKIIGDIKPYSKSNSLRAESTSKKINTVITTCSQSIETCLSVAGTYEVYVVETCSTTYIADYGGGGGSSGDVSPYIGGGGGSGSGSDGGNTEITLVPLPITTENIANALAVDDGKPPIDPEKFKKCFDDGKQASSYKITLYIDQPVAGSNNQWSLSSGSGNKFTTNNNITFNVGHAFVGFEKINTDGTSVTQVMGFYPGSLGANVNGVIKDDSGHQFDVSYSAFVNSSQFQFALNNVIADNLTKNYILSNVNGGIEYNCTDAAINWMTNAGINLPNSSPRGIFNNTPGDFGQALRQIANANKNSGFAPTGHGACN